MKNLKNLDCGIERDMEEFSLAATKPAGYVFAATAVEPPPFRDRQFSVNVKVDKTSTLWNLCF